MLPRNLGDLSGDTRSTAQFLWTALSISIGLFGLWNAYIWVEGKSLKTLAHLLDEVDKHNEIIEAMHIIDELRAVKNSTIALIDRDEILQALNATRESLVCALMTEKVLRKHKRFMARRQELFVRIETNLAMLQTLQVNHEANEYGQLLNEALQIGMSIRHEVNRLGNQ